MNRDQKMISVVEGKPSSN